MDVLLGKSDPGSFALGKIPGNPRANQGKEKYFFRAGKKTGQRPSYDFYYIFHGWQAATIPNNLSR
jgi:hypothetical protein